MLSDAILGSLVATCGGLLMQIISKVKCVYRRTENGCEPACACMDGKIEKDHELSSIEEKRSYVYTHLIRSWGYVRAGQDSQEISDRPPSNGNTSRSPSSTALVLLKNGNFKVTAHPTFT